MNRTTWVVIIVIAVVLAMGISGVALYLGRSGATSSGSPQDSLFQSKDMDAKSPQDALQEFIRLKIKEDFWPDKYDVVKDDSDLVRLGFGRRYAINYSMNWRKSDSSFLTFVGYDKKQSDQLIGYTLDIYVKGVAPKGHDVAQIFLKDLPARGWMRSEPRAHDRFTSEVSNVLWKGGENKLYLSVLSLSYKEPEPGFFSDEAVKEVTIIRLRVYNPKNWQYDQVEEFQRADHSIYGQ